MKFLCKKSYDEEFIKGEIYDGDFVNIRDLKILTQINNHFTKFPSHMVLYQ